MNGALIMLPNDIDLLSGGWVGGGGGEETRFKDYEVISLTIYVKILLFNSFIVSLL